MTRKNIVIVAGILGALAMIRKKTVSIRHLLKSHTADRLGIDNKPDKDAKKRLLWLAEVEPKITQLLQQISPDAKISSAFRSPALNAVIGGSPTSRHQRALALDYVVNDVYAAAEYLHHHKHSLTPHLRTVIAETTPVHLHIDFFDPFDHSDTRRPARFLYEISPPINNFIRLEG